MSLTVDQAAVNRVYSWIFRIWRKRRFDLFFRVLQPNRSQSLLDVGGYPVFWTSNPMMVEAIDTLNLEKVDWDGAAFPEHRIRTLVGNGCRLEMPDDSYDIVFSNSVIEHVGPWENQVAFANEIRRVGRSVWVQTPARECPIEPHYLMPFIHWTPKWFQKKVIRRLSPWGWFGKPSQDQVNFEVDNTRLVRLSEMKVLFPDCEIHTERLSGIFPKSYIAIRRCD